MHCPHCKGDHPKDAQFCPLTGKKIKFLQSCPECGNPVDPSWQHCGFCGRKLISAEDVSKKEEGQPAGVPPEPTPMKGGSDPGVGSAKVTWPIILRGIGGLVIVTIILFFAIRLVVIDIWNDTNLVAAAPTASTTPTVSVAPASQIIHTPEIIPTSFPETTPTTAIIPTSLSDTIPTTAIIPTSLSDTIPTTVIIPTSLSDTIPTTVIIPTSLSDTIPTTVIIPTSLSDTIPTTVIIPTSLPSWEKFEGNGVEFWLPGSYDGGNLNEDLNTIVENLRKLSPEFENAAAGIEKNPEIFALWAFDSIMGDSGGLTSAAITSEKVLSAVNINTYLDAAQNQLPDSFFITDRQIVKLNQYDAGRLVIDFSVSGYSGKELIYVIKIGNMFWLITYGTGAVEFDQRLPEFEKSALTFKVND
jgi:hypothetical protein